MKNVILGIIAVVALGAAVFIVMSREDGVRDDPSETMSQVQVWVCNTCKAETSMTKQEWVEATTAGRMGCQACGGVDLVSAVFCPNPECGKAMATIGHGRLPAQCPHCQFQLGDWEDRQDPSLPPPG